MVRQGRRGATGVQQGVKVERQILEDTMVKSILQRWLPWIFGDAAQGRPAALPASATPAPESRGANPPAGEGVQAIPEPAVIGVRRPLISSDGDVAGFEIRMGEDVARQLKRQADPHAQAARLAALLTSASLVVQTGRIGFARMPVEWLLQAKDLEIVPGVLIGLESTLAVVPLPQATVAMEQAVLALRAKGVQVGWELESEWGAKVLPDFVLLRQGAHSMSTLLDTLSARPPQWQGLPVLVTDIGNVEELEMALYNGVTYACGVLDSETVAMEPAGKQAVPPEVRRVGLLLNQLASGADTAVIVGQIKGDVGLSYRLLSRINSASYAQLGSYASVEQAVLLLGRHELYRWLSLLLVQFAGSRKTSSALQEMALWRSRLLELLAIENQEAMPDQFFTLGLASMLGQILKISQAEVVNTLSLPAFATQALLEHSGPWYSYLQVAKRIETHTLDPAAELVAQFGGTARLLTLSDQAWRWATEQASHADASAAKVV